MTTKFKIDSNIPMTTVRPGPKCKYPYDRLKVGQSFFIPGATTVFTLTIANKNLAPKRFASRKRAEGGVTGRRVWRVK